MTAATSSGENAPGSLSLGPWLKQRRRVLDLTQDELAQKSSCSLATIRKIEAGDLLPSKQLAQQIAVALGVPEVDHAAFVAFARAERAAVMATAFSASPVTSVRFAPPVEETPPRRHHMPAQLTPLVGREWEIQASCALLRRPVARLLTLTGPPGSGKTRLALAIAEALQQDFQSGAIFVPLAPISDPTLVAGAIAQTLGLRLGSGRANTDSLIEHLHGQQLLIVLDNFEQLIAAAPLLMELLMAVAGLKFIVTSRTLLRVYGEHEFPVPPLPLPDASEMPPPDELMLYPAVELFVQRASAVQPSFTLTPENAKAVVQICTWVEGLPLAIEMAAAQVKWHSPQIMVSQLGQRLAYLSGGPRYLAPRQQTLRGAIEWSYNLLDEDQRPLFDALAVFVGGCTLEAVMAVVSQVKHLPMNLQALVDHSLLKLQTAGDVPPRYEMLETLREYAVERLAAQGDALTTYHAHASYFLSLAQASLAHLAGENQELWLDRLEADDDNLRAALAWCITNDVVMGLQLATALGEFWYMRGYLSEGRDHLETLLTRIDSTTPLPVRAAVLQMTGYLAFRQGDHLDAKPLLEESLSLYRTLNDQEGIAATLHHLGVAAFHQNEYATAQQLYEESLALYQRLGRSNKTAIVLKDLGLVAKDRGELDQAMAYLEQSLALQRQASNKHGVARCLTSMSIVAYWQGDFERAADLGWQSLALQRELGDRLGMAYSLENLGMALFKMGDIAIAVRQMEECLALFHTTGDKNGMVLALDNLGILALAQGNLTDAIGFHTECLSLAWEIGEKRRIAFAFEGLAYVAGQSERAVQLFAGAAALRAAISAPLLPSDRANYEHQLRQLRIHLGREKFDSLWEVGETRTLEEAVTYALET